jgi:hypothetical protein
MPNLCSDMDAEEMEEKMERELYAKIIRLVQEVQPSEEVTTATIAEPKTELSGGTFRAGILRSSSRDIFEGIEVGKHGKGETKASQWYQRVLQAQDEQRGILEG